MIFEFLRDMILSILQMLNEVQFQGIPLLTILIAMALFSLLIEFIRGLYD